MDLKIFTDNIKPEALEQINTLANLPAFENAKIRIMPDVHAGKGCVIGFTANLGNKVIPNIVGVDIGCGMYTVPLGKIKIDYAKFDRGIRGLIPSGFDIHEETINDCDFTLFRCYDKLKNIDRLSKSLGTLGGGNHFIEIDEDDEGNKYLIIHTGSRNLGKQIAEIYQDIAINKFYNNESLKKAQTELINSLKRQGRQTEIEGALKELKKDLADPGIPKELCYLEFTDRLNYIWDMVECQEFARVNRVLIAERLMWYMGWENDPDVQSAKTRGAFHTVHNYINVASNIVRKGAISAQKGERVLIPINMRDGCILGTGKGNEDWNYSAPHGAGRIMSRTAAKEKITLEEYQKSMEGIYSTSVSMETIDESPMAYKPINEIVEKIKDTVIVDKIIKPVYNFKAGEQEK